MTNGKRIDVSGRMREDPGVAVYGASGSHTHRAAREAFGDVITTIHCKSAKEALAELGRGTRIAVLPIENSTEGPVVDTCDTLLRKDGSLLGSNRIVGEILLPINHALLARKEVSLEQIRIVYSHPQALGQCRGYIESIGAETRPYSDTASAAKMLLEQKLGCSAAIAHESVTRMRGYEGLHVLANCIEDDKSNTTRFDIIADQPIEGLCAEYGNAAMLAVIGLQNKPGRLYSIMGVLKDMDINLTNLVTRPSKEEPWKYSFLITIDAHPMDRGARRTVENLREIAGLDGATIRLLGLYPKANPVRISYSDGKPFE